MHSSHVHYTGRMSKKLTHTNDAGSIQMVDVADKSETDRVAVAEAQIQMTAETLSLIRDNKLKKGDVLSTARLAGIQAAKQTGLLIPLCHPLALNAIDVDCVLDDTIPGVKVTTRVRCHGRTGVEMEALTAASVAALTIYDMAKAVDKGMTILCVQLVSKTGGKGGDWHRSDS